MFGLCRVPLKVRARSSGRSVMPIRCRHESQSRTACTGSSRCHLPGRVHDQHWSEWMSLQPFLGGRLARRLWSAQAGRPVRARAVEPAAPTPWNMIVFPDGAVTDVAEHPAPPTVAEEHKQEWASVVAAHVAEHPDLLAEPTLRPAPTRDTDAPAPPTLTAPPATLVPEAYREQWAAVWAAHAAGDLPTAVVLALKLENALEAECGPLDPCTVNLLTVRAWLTLSQRTDLQDTVELLITTVLRRQAAKVRPKNDTARAACNAVAVWVQLLDEDPHAALAVSSSLADMLAIRGWENHREVLARTETASALAG